MRLRTEACMRQWIPNPSRRGCVTGHELQPRPARHTRAPTPQHQHHGRHDEADRPCKVSGAGAPRHRQLLRLRVSCSLSLSTVHAQLTAAQLHRRRHSRVVPPAALQDHTATLFARPESAVRPAWHRVGHCEHRQHPHPAGEHHGHGLLQGDWEVPLRSRPARHRTDWRAVVVLLLHVRLLSPRPRCEC